MKRRAITIDQALADPKLLGGALGDARTWTPWLAVLRAAFGLCLSDEQRAIFLNVAGGRGMVTQRVRELWCLIGRRGGKKAGSPLRWRFTSPASCSIAWHAANTAWSWCSPPRRNKLKSCLTTPKRS